jgi:hypothetical protein
LVQVTYFTVLPETGSKNESREENDVHSFYAINHLIVVTMHQMGVGPYHTQMFDRAPMETDSLLFPLDRRDVGEF